ncbi:MAG: Nicotinate-nucleotide adenylyltransferase [Chlamydiales bacterium]|nr:Nicotinate-nucleotide adenylyltransferase [Chlamydiales bacterium]MCH9635394.1 Nicotinate-nucleotide adenylyltransferase [Chlamydiales bacterium]
MSKTALLGGSFDPPHFGHLNLAIEVLEQKKFDHIYFMPANISPGKSASAPASARLEMAKRLIAPIKQFELLDLEIKRGGVSYMVDTLRELDERVTLILADDAYAHFDEWKEPSTITQLAEILVVKRHQKGLEIPQMEISSSRLRERLKKGLYCGHLTSVNVLDYIYENQLYSNP